MKLKSLEISRRTLLASAVLSITSSFPASAANEDLKRGLSNNSEVALTFHGAGDDSINSSILKECVNAGVPITVFAVGTWLQNSSAIAKAFVNANFELGNHTLNHKSMRKLSAKEARLEIQGGADELKKLIGNIGIGFRPSGTQFSTNTIRTAASAVGYSRCISYDVDSMDYLDLPVAKILKNIQNSVTSGSIVSLHLGHKNTLTALPQIFSLLETRKLKPVPISKFLVS